MIWFQYGQFLRDPFPGSVKPQEFRIPEHPIVSGFSEEPRVESVEIQSLAREK